MSVALAILSAAVLAPSASGCEQAITMARAASGLPALDRTPARPEEPLLIKAVDKRIARCRVLVMASNPSDIRPEPRASDDRPRLRPAR